MYICIKRIHRIAHFYSQSSLIWSLKKSGKHGRFLGYAGNTTQEDYTIMQHVTIVNLLFFSGVCNHINGVTAPKIRSHQVMHIFIMLNLNLTQTRDLQSKPYAKYSYITTLK